MLVLRAHLRRLMYVSTLLISLALTLYGGSLCAQGAEPTPPAPLDVKIERGTLTVKVHNAPLAQVLRAIGERAGIQVTVRGDVSSPVTQSFAGVPLEEGIKRLTHGYSLVLIHAAAGKSRTARLTRVWVLGGTSTPSSFTAATNTPEPTIEPQRQAPRQPGVTRQAALPSAPAKARVSEVMSAPQRPHWAQEIQTLTEAADRGSEAAVTLLGDIIATEADAAVRRQAVAALGRLTGVEVEPVLLAALGDVEAAVRVRAVRGLRTAGTDTAAQSLAAVVVGDPDPQVRLAAVRALLSIPGRTMVQGLEQASADSDTVVRTTAARGLSWWQTHLPALP